MTKKSSAILPCSWEVTARAYLKKQNETKGRMPLLKLFLCILKIHNAFLNVKTTC